MDAKTEANPNDAGTYIIENGVRRLLEAATVDHPDGNCARPADDVPPAEPANDTSLAARLTRKLKGGEQ